jgi:hypothetical protein
MKRYKFIRDRQVKKKKKKKKLSNNCNILLYLEDNFLLKS